MSDEQPRWYEEEKEMPRFWGWVVITLFSAAIVGYGIATYFLVGDGPRQWDYRVLPDTPAQSIYNTSRPKRPVQAPLQIAPLPGAGPEGK